MQSALASRPHVAQRALPRLTRTGEHVSEDPETVVPADTVGDPATTQRCDDS
jgi:hypothetical protein